MHELSYIIDIVNTVLDETKNRSIKKVKKIEVDVGEMSGVIPYYLHKYYPEVVAGTELNDTVLVTNEIEVKIKCEECGNNNSPFRLLVVLDAEIFLYHLRQTPGTEACHQHGCH